MKVNKQFWVSWAQETPRVNFLSFLFEETLWVLSPACRLNRYIRSLFQSRLICQKPNLLHKTFLYSFYMRPTFKQANTNTSIFVIKTRKGNRALQCRKNITETKLYMWTKGETKREFEEKHKNICKNQVFEPNLVCRSEKMPSQVKIKLNFSKLDNGKMAIVDEGKLRYELRGNKVQQSILEIKTKQESNQTWSLWPDWMRLMTTMLVLHIFM